MSEAISIDPTDPVPWYARGKVGMKVRTLHTIYTYLLSSFPLFPDYTLLPIFANTILDLIPNSYYKKYSFSA